jgi:protoheme IX farnesyltransferase
MAPLIWGERETMMNMIWYTLILVPVTLLPVAFGAFGWIYGVSALVLGGILLAGTIEITRRAEWTPLAWRVYKYSLLYLALLFVAMVVDRGLAR